MFSVEKYFDPRVISINHHYEQYERSSIINTYHRSVLKKCIRISGIRSGMSVLDYGCGRKILRKYLPVDIDYIGYDIISKFTDIVDIRGKKYDVIFAIQVLQYIDNKGLNDILVKLKFNKYKKICFNLKFKKYLLIIIIIFKLILVFIKLY